MSTALPQPQEQPIRHCPYCDPPVNEVVAEVTNEHSK